MGKGTKTMKIVMFCAFAMALFSYQPHRADPQPVAVQQQDAGPDCENRNNDPHQCQCKGMQDGPAYDDDGNLLASACKKRELYT
jgi:hypothetical protein